MSSVGVLHGINTTLSKKNVSSYRYHKKLFIIVPKSSHTYQTLKDRKDHQGRILDFARMPAVNPAGLGRSYSCHLYKILNVESIEEVSDIVFATAEN